MKKIIFFSFICLFFVYPLSASDFFLKGNVSGLNSKMVYLYEIKGDKTTLLDSTSNHSGTFEILLKTDYHPGMYRIMLGAVNSSNFFEKDPSFFDFIFNNENISLETSVVNPIKNMKVLSSDENALYYEYLYRTEAFGQKFSKLLGLLDIYSEEDTFYSKLAEEIVDKQIQYNDYLIKESENHNETFVSEILSFSITPVFDPEKHSDFTNFMRDHFLDQTSFNVPNLIYSNLITKKIINYMTFFMDPSYSQEMQEDKLIVALDNMYDDISVDTKVFDFVVEFLIDGFQRFNMEKVLIYLADSYLTGECETNNEKILKKRLKAFKKMENGKKADNISLLDNKGNVKRLSDLDKDYILVLFWSTECPHCKSILPQIKKWSADKKNLQIFAVSIDPVKEKWIKYLENNDLPWINVYEFGGWEGKTAENYNVYATPGMYLLNNNRTILSKPVTFRQLKKDFLQLSEKTQ